MARLIEEGWSADLLAAFGPLPAAGPPTPAPGPILPPAAPPAPPAPPAPAGLAGSVLAVLDGYALLLDPEIWIRFGTQIRGLVTGPDAAKRVADHVLEAARAAALAWAADWPDDVPTSDEEKKGIKPFVAFPKWVGHWIDAVVREIPGATAGPADWAQVGRDVHRAVLADYAANHRDRLVVIDGRVRVIARGVDVVVSRIGSPQGGLLDPTDVAKLERFAEVMRDPQTQRSIRPDIADLQSAPVGPRDDWGWFELKPMADLRAAIEELYGYYLPR